MSNFKTVLFIIFAITLQTRVANSEPVENEDSLYNTVLNAIEKYQQEGGTQIYDVVNTFLTTGTVDSSALFQIFYDIMRQNVDLKHVNNLLNNVLPTQALTSVTDLFKQYPALMNFLKTISGQGREFFESFRNTKAMEHFDNLMRSQNIDIDHIYNVMYNVFGWHNQSR